MHGPSFSFSFSISLPILVSYFCSMFNSYLPEGSRGKYPPLSPTLRWLIVLVYATQTEKLPGQDMGLFLTINKHYLEELEVNIHHFHLSVGESGGNM